VAAFGVRGFIPAFVSLFFPFFRHTPKRNNTPCFAGGSENEKKKNKKQKRR
jgi:hypothetical protein